MPVQKYYSEDDTDQIMLEDDSGRVQLVGDLLKTVPLVTGCIIAVMGTENVNGELEVIDIRFPDLAPQPERWSLSKRTSGIGKLKKKEEDTKLDVGAGGKIAIVSGLSFSGADASHSLELDLLLEYLIGEALTPSDQDRVSRISRLIIAGNSVSVTEHKTDADDVDKKPIKRFGYDSSWYNPLPSQLFDGFLSEVLPSMPVTLMPSVQDPSNGTYPQQPVHAAMFPTARTYWQDPASSQPGWLDAVTNPWEGEIEGWKVLGTGGQNVDDMFKYVSSDDRLGMMEAMCRWRCCAPTAPDTLCMKSTPPIVRVNALTNSVSRELSVPRRRPLRYANVPSPLLRWLPATILHQGHSRPRRPKCSFNHNSVILRHQRDSPR